MDSSASTTNGADGESQFFDYPSGLNLEVPFVVGPNSTYDLFEKVKPYLANFSINVNKSEDVKIQSAKSYWRHSGHLPFDLVQEEMNNANKNPMHIPDLNKTQLSVMYLVYKVPIVGEAYQIKHQIIELCAKVKKNDFRHFIIDRGYNGVYPNVWNSRIRVIYTGKSDNCSLDDKAWADKRSGTWNKSGVVTDQLHLVNQGQVKNYRLNNLINDALYYFRKFPIYNTLYNCQHFGANLFSRLTKQKTDFISNDTMIISDEDGKTNLKDLIFKFIKSIFGKDKKDVKEADVKKQKKEKTAKKEKVEKKEKKEDKEKAEKADKKEKKEKNETNFNNETEQGNETYENNETDQGNETYDSGETEDDFNETYENNETVEDANETYENNGTEEDGNETYDNNGTEEEGNETYDDNEDSDSTRILEASNKFLGFGGY